MGEVDAVMPAVPAALALTVLFVADDPRAPAVVIDVIEDASGRRADVVVVQEGAPPRITEARAGAIDASPRLRALPVPPPGVGITPAADGVVLTVDDVGEWPPAPPPAPRAGPSSSAPPRVILPLASPRGLRLYASSLEPAPAPATLVGPGGPIPGTALVTTTAAPTAALSVTAGPGPEADGSAPVVLAEAPGGCASIPTKVSQRVTWLSATAVACSRGLLVSLATGTRLGERPAEDVPARGVVVRRR